ncbi:MAG: GGDEF domain-containing protein [Rhodospirillales bacterium]
MEVKKPDTVTPIDGSSAGGERKHPEGQRKRAGSGADDGAGRDRGATRSITDKVTIMGIPAGMLTPEVHQAIDTLMEKTEHLSQALEWTRDQRANLQKLADSHGFLPVLNRRAFVRELGNVLSQSEHLAAPASLLRLHVTNGATIRRERGRRAVDQALAHVCGVLAEELHPTDVVGSLGGDDFGVVLLAADLHGAVAKGAAVAMAVRGRPFEWEGEDIVLDVASAARVLEPGADAEEILAAADQDLLAEEEPPDPGADEEQTGG